MALDTFRHTTIVDGPLSKWHCGYRTATRAPSVERDLLRDKPACLRWCTAMSCLRLVDLGMDGADCQVRLPTTRNILIRGDWGIKIVIVIVRWLTSGFQDESVRPNPKSPTWRTWHSFLQAMPSRSK